MKWKVTVIHSDSSVEESTFDTKPEALDYYNYIVTTAREKEIAVKVHLTSVGQVLEFKRKEKCQEPENSKPIV